MKKNGIFVIVLTTLLALSGCSKNSENAQENASFDDFGVFLGVTDEMNYSHLYSYKKIAIEIEEFSSSTIKSFKDRDIELYSYLSIGSLEKYRDYYDDFKDYTFFDYENWEDEEWIDVSQYSWQAHLISEATKFKELGSDGLFLDNFDVYYIVMEEYECSSSFKEGIYQGCRTILSELSKLNMKILINSGTDFLERLEEENNPLIDKIDWYAQETVFSSIEDYDNDVFGVQDNETHYYYENIIKMMKKHSDVLLIEYTKDDLVKKAVRDYCNREKLHYYISNSVALI